MQLDGALLDATRFTRRLDHADEPVVDLAGDERRALFELEPEQAARRLVGQQDPAVGVESDDARIEQQAECPQHRDAVSTGLQVAHADHVHPSEYTDEWCAEISSAATRWLHSEGRGRGAPRPSGQGVWDAVIPRALRSRG